MIAAEAAAKQPDANDASATDGDAESTPAAASVETSRNRRSQSRSSYDCVQLIAPFDGDKLPTQADFRHVVCRDLSTSGISFMMPQRLATERVIVALGSVPFSFVVAETVRTEFTDDGEVLIGCRFVERLKP